MRLNRRDFVLGAGSIGAATLLPSAVFAQAKPMFDVINMFIPAAPGGGWDGTGRAIEAA